MYRDEMLAALKLTRCLGLDCESVRRFEAALVPCPATNDSEVVPFLYDWNRKLPPHARVANCMRVHTGAFLDSIMLGWEARPVLTIGNVMVHGKPRYPGDEDYAISQVVGRYTEDQFNLHVWWTFPDMSIIDLCLGYALATEDPSWGDVENEDFDIFVSPDDPKVPFTYKPMLLGERYLLRADTIPQELVDRIEALYGTGL